MTKTEIVNKLNRMLLVAEGLPEEADVISADVKISGNLQIHVRDGTVPGLTERRRMDMRYIVNYAHVSGVEIAAYVLDEVPEGV